MSEAAIFLGWDRPISGREAVAQELVERLYRYLQELKTSGQLSLCTRVLLEPHGGRLNGFVLIEGEASKLQDIKQSEAWRNGVARLALAMDGVMVNQALTGAEVDRENARVATLLKG